MRRLTPAHPRPATFAATNRIKTDVNPAPGLKACIAGAYEHPTRKAPDKTVAQLHAECARGALVTAVVTRRRGKKLSLVMGRDDAAAHLATEHGGKA